MRTAALLLLCVAAAGCAQMTPSGHELQPTAQRNDVATINVSLGIEYIKRGEYEKAVEKLERAREADPSYPLTYNTYGVLYQQIGDFARAEENFKKALSLDPNDSATMNNYGRFLCLRNQPKQAEEMLLRAAANPLYQTPEIPITNAGTCAFNDGRPADAEKYFRRALEIDPQQPVALLHMAQISYDKGEFLPARGYFQRYTAVEKHTAESLWLGIQIEKKLGDNDAVSSYALLLRNNFPDSEQTRQLNESGTR